MKKLVVLGVSALAAVFVALGVTPPASAYPETSCNVTVSAQKVFSGSKLKVTAQSQEIVTDNPRLAVAGTEWRAEFNGEVHSATTDVFVTTFNIPKVTAKTTFLLTVSAVMPGATSTCEKSLNITVLPNSIHVTPPGHHLPNTGGPRLIFLIGGIALVIAGAGAVAQSRRRHEALHAA